MIFFAWLSNKTDCQDDEWLKIKANSKKQAKRIAEEHCRWNFYVSSVMTRKQMKKYDPWVHAHEWGRKAANEWDKK
jgi:hypothetical protein